MPKSPNHINFLDDTAPLLAIEIQGIEHGESAEQIQKIVEAEQFGSTQPLAGEASA